MQRLWGRKISDLAFGEFLQILEWVAKKKNKLVVFIDQWYPSSKTCSCCGHVLESLDLSGSGVVHLVNRLMAGMTTQRRIFKQSGHRLLG
jgi:transposase